jgi:hypothetical protein
MEKNLLLSTKLDVPILVTFKIQGFMYDLFAHIQHELFVMNKHMFPITT